MLVEELVAKLLKMPQKAEVIKTSSDGCSDCNPEGMDYYHDVYSVDFKAEGDYPNSRHKNVVVL